MTLFPSFAILTCLADGRINPGVVLAAVTLGLLWFFVAFVGERATFAGRRFFILANGGLSYWLLLTVLEQWTNAPQCKMTFAMLAYPGIVIAPTAWMFFVYRYAYGVSGRMRLSHRLALSLAPAIITLAALTNGWHGLFYMAGSGPQQDLPGAPIRYIHGPLFFGAAAYIYMTMLACLGLLGLGAFIARPGYRLHFVILLLLTLVPMVGNVGYVLFDWSIFGFDPTPFLFIVVAFAYGALILSNRLFEADIRPVLSPLGELRPVIGWTVLLEDVSQRRAEEQRLAKALARRSAQLTAAMQAQQEAETLALRDPLTGLLNRRGLDRLITHLQDQPGYSR